MFHLKYPMFLNPDLEHLKKTSTDIIIVGVFYSHLLIYACNVHDIKQIQTTTSKTKSITYFNYSPQHFALLCSYNYLFLYAQSLFASLYTTRYMMECSSQLSEV